MQSFIAKPSLDQKLPRGGGSESAPLVLMRPQKPSRNRVKQLLKQ